MPARSKVAEMAAEEAARAEAEEPDEADDEEAAADEEAVTPQPEPDEGEQPDEEADEGLSAETFASGIDRELKRHDSELRRLFGEPYEAFVECPVCHLLGVVDPTVVPIDDSVMRCVRCNGSGELLTGATNPNNITRQCPECIGNGYVPRPLPPPPPAQMTYAQPAPGAYMPPPQLPPSPDMPSVAPMPALQYDAQANVWRAPDGSIVGAGNGQGAGVPVAT